MPVKEPVFKSQLTGTVDSFLNEKRRTSIDVQKKSDGEAEFIDILTFIDRFKLLSDGLYPVQKFIVKMYYNIPLNDTEKSITITDRFNTKTLHNFTEVEYLKYLYDQGRCNISAQDGKTRHELILVLGRRSGKCIHGSSKVFTNKGIFNIEELGNIDGDEWQDIDITVASNSHKEVKATKFYNPGINITKTIVTKYGYEICGTPEHRIKVISEFGSIVWKQLCNINKGDIIGINRGNNIWSDDYVDMSVYSVYGPDNYTRIYSIFNEFHGRITGYFTNSTKYDIKERIYDLIDSGALKSLGFDWIDDESKCKHVPWVIMRSPKSVVASYISSIFEECDINEQDYSITLLSESKTLLTDIQCLLNNFGIISKVFHDNNGKYFISIIDYKSRLIFVRDIGINDIRKHNIIEFSIESKHGKDTNIEKIPFQKYNFDFLMSSSCVSNLPHEYYTELRSICYKDGEFIDPSYDDINNIINISNKYGVESNIISELEYLNEQNYFWDSVCDIQCGINRVYDLTVPGGHRYIANCITNHNSALSAIFASYELYKLLCRGHPQAYYGMPYGSEIRILCIANDKDQASIVYGDVQSHVEAIDYFKNSVANSTQTYMRFRTLNDKEKFGENGKCIREGSLVFTGSGITPIEKLGNVNGDEWQKINIEVAQEGHCRSTAEYFYNVKTPQTTKIITTENGYEICGTYEHRIKVLSKDGDIIWKSLKEINEGDYVGIHRSTNIWAKDYLSSNSFLLDSELNKCNKIIDNDWGEILGILFSGCHLKDGGWIEVTCNSYSLNYIINLFNRKLGHYTIIGYDKKRNGNRIYKIRVYSKSLHNYISDNMSDECCIPDCILRSPKSVMSSFIRGMCEIHGKINNKYYIEINNTKLNLLKNIQVILLNFGIISSLYRKFGKNRLIISNNESLKIFFNDIKFMCNENNSLYHENDINDLIPFVGNIISYYATKYDKLNSIYFNNYKYGNSNISYDDLYKFIKVVDELAIENCDTQVLKLILESNYFWNKVKTVKKSNNKVYDLSVPCGESFAAQGFTNHNSTVAASFKSSVAKGLRGRGVICSILDEIAFFIDTGKSSAEQIYRAMNPSLAQFSPKDSKNRSRAIGPSDGRMILISSPDAREGLFYNQYLLSKSNNAGSKDMLMIQAPTWEVNPSIDSSFYEKEYHKNPRAFVTEIGAEFSDRVKGWVEDAKDLTDCIDLKLRPKTRGNPREIHFAGVDFGLSNDGTSISLTKINNGKIELAYHEVWYPRVSWKEANPHLEAPFSSYCYKLKEVQRLDVDEIAEWFLALSKKFYILKGMFDQWAGPVFEQILHKKGLHQFEMRNMFTNESSQMYQIFKMNMLNRQIVLYDWPLPEGGEAGFKHSPLITELLELQATSGGKNITVVEAPRISGKHDDQSDSLARSILLATEYTSSNPSVLNEVRSFSMPSQRISNYGYTQYHRMRNKLHGSVKERTIPKRR